MKQNDITEYQSYCLRSASGRLLPVVKGGFGSLAVTREGCYLP